MKTNKTKRASSASSSASEDAHHLKTRRGSSSWAIILIIFFVALGVRLLTRQDARVEAGKVQSSVTSDYKRVAQLLAQGGAGSFFDSSSPLGNPDNLGHPPGYSILMAFVNKVFGESDATLQLIQILCDAIAAVVLFLIVVEILPTSVAAIAGFLAAFSPQFAWNSVLLLPDTLAVLPILLAVYCLTLASKRPQLVLIIAAGALVGVSCWLRANALLLPFFLAALVFFLFERQKRARYATALAFGALLIIAPLTIRNAIVFGHFIPLSLGAGQTFLEGIADYDKGQKFDLPNTDLGIMNQEANAYNRPDYRETLFGPDGIQRERSRLARGFALIRSRPLWFMAVMVRRAANMLRLERTSIISPEPPVTHSLALTEQTQPISVITPADLIASSTLISPKATATAAPDGQAAVIRGDNSKYEKQFASAAVAVRKNVDYVWLLPIKIEQGRLRVGVASADQKRLYASAIIDILEGRSPQEQPVQIVQLPFVSGSDGNVRLVLSNEASNALPLIHVGTIKLYELGPASFVWTRYPRTLTRGVQKVFLTAVILPLTVIGIALLARAKQGRDRRRALATLLVVPAYYLCVQSATHTEYRYILSIYYFLFALAAVTLSWTGNVLWHKLRALKA